MRKSDLFAVLSVVGLAIVIVVGLWCGVQIWGVIPEDTRLELVRAIVRSIIYVVIAMISALPLLLFVTAYFWTAAAERGSRASADVHNR